MKKPSILLKIAVVMLAGFVMYRAYFYPNLWSNIVNISMNAFFDTVVCMAATITIYSLVEGRWKLQRKPMAYAIAWILLVMVASAALVGFHWLGYTISGYMQGQFVETFRQPGFQVFDVLTVVVVGTTSGFSVLKFKEANESQRHLMMLKTDREQAELSFLKSQMNPHFIFNSLNTIYFSIDKAHPAREIVSTFSDLLRFQLYECSNDLISLKQEISFLRQYLRLHEIRMSDSMDLQVELPQHVPHSYIAPLLIIPFVENALKHAGSGKQEKREVHISLEVDDRWLNYRSVNSLDIHDKSQPNKKGIGIRNARRRMDLLFGKNYLITSQKNQGQYVTQLKIPLQ